MPPTAAPEARPAASRRPSALALSSLPPAKLGEFEGPLDLLLHLVRAGRMDVFDLPIATLCDQYIAIITEAVALDLTVAGEFLVMAATLLEIKSRLLLPAPPKEETDEGLMDGAVPGIDPADPRAELVARLLEYGRYQAIAETLRLRESDRRDLFFRDPIDPRGAAATGYVLPPKFGELSADDLLRTLERVLAAVGAGERSITSVRRQKITLRMKMREVLTLSERSGAEGIDLQALIPEPPFALLEIVLLFLALLELLKTGSVLVAQEGFCGEIRVFFVPEAERSALVGEETDEGIASEHRTGDVDPE